MSWLRPQRDSSPLTAHQFGVIMEDRLSRRAITLQDAVRVAARVVEDEAGRRDVAWMASWHTAYMHTDPFLLLRLRELAGAVVVDHDDEYVLAMISSLGGLTNSRRFLFTEDAGLREDVFWRIFEVEGGGQVSLTNVDKFSRSDETWQETVLGLVSDGVLPRDQVLRSCLEALLRDFAAYTAGWFSRLYVAFEPTVDELAAGEPQLLALLSSQVSTMVTLAVAGLRTLHASGRGDPAGLIAHSAHALLSGKANAIAVLKMLRRVANTDEGGAAAAIAVALDHPHPDVRSAAGRALRELGRSDLLPDEQSAAEVHFVARPMLPVEQARVSPWPADETVERLAAILAGNADGIEFELALATLATLQDRSILSPLAMAARRRAAPPDWPRRGPMSAVLIARLLMDVLGEHVEVDEWDPTAKSVIGARTAELGDSLRNAPTAGVLLATPDERTGWLHPHTLVDRVLLRDHAGLQMPTADLVAALLRLSTVDRAGALSRLSAGADTPGNRPAFDAVAYALGGQTRAIEPVEWWIAAARARDPLGVDELLVAKGYDRPGEGTRASVLEEWVEVKSTHFWEAPTYLRLRVNAGRSTAIDALRPTCVPSTGGPKLYYEWENPWQLFGELVFPPDADVAAVLGLQLLVQGLSTVTEYGQADILDGLARHPGVWGPTAASALVLGLSQQPAQTRIHAAELFATVVPARASITNVADAFVRHAPGCVSTRWASALADSASISTDAEHAVAQTLVAFLPRLPSGLRGLDKLLDVLVDTTQRDSQALADTLLRDWLAETSGTSRAARAARTLRERAEAELARTGLVI